MASPSRRIPLPQHGTASPATKRHMKKHIDRYLQEVAFDAAQHIYDTMIDPTMPPDLRLRAAFDIMDRTQGKAASKTDQAVLDEMQEHRDLPNLDQVPTEKLESILKQLDAYTDTIDAVPAPTEPEEEFNFDE